MVFGLGFMAFFCLRGLSTNACLKTWVLVDIGGALKVAKKFLEVLELIHYPGQNLYLPRSCLKFYGVTNLGSNLLL
jgi:hypothetical protein